MRVALYQPDIPQNTGTIIRMAACLGVSVDIIGPAGFDMSDRGLRRAGLDYIGQATLTRHASFAEFSAMRAARGWRVILLTTAGNASFADFQFREDDVLLLGRESAGVPTNVHETADARIIIPMKPGMRSINVAVATAMVLGVALSQTGHFAGYTGQIE